ncbi:MAG: ABC transporter ATP-binding protein [Candidatus Electrothrix sp. AW2]|jgi:ABC-type nitrate/sulfonate/bicarbonate transport system ATPase subunit|nr:ABC transporter ATP-binding protein [Candidatus Electrothrix sp. AX1]MCI5116918.1 ABC transporter ATP-binding protein [Candidatus Electrothrix gigas]MCI5126945.1 ABC transporter ATP-binding protein [Candidatus Electrothrix gigas]MCI5134275.1 ABC transporter ATP-binding protein [Candidatus Electrothrix gigas]MCI5178032.1 ABC transporter ATP-binding protein [Candidatus Electrothrix gigas]
MGHIKIDSLCREFVNRRKKKREDSGLAYGEKVSVLEDINIEVEDGEMVCLLGPSGCGKSTLLRIIAGFDKQSSGSILIDEKEITGPSSDNIFVFQHSGLLPWMTVWQNVELGLRHMQNAEEKKAEIQEYIEMVELDNFEQHYPHQLSGGMQRRAELARALAVNPDILIMDEPFSGLDFLTHMKMREEVVNMHQFLGKTILIVTHDIDDALIMGDRVVVFSKRPSQVKMNRKLDFPHPRIVFNKQTELSKLRDELFFMLGVSYAV